MGSIWVIPLGTGLTGETALVEGLLVNVPVVVVVCPGISTRCELLSLRGSFGPLPRPSPRRKVWLLKACWSRVPTGTIGPPIGGRLLFGGACRPPMPLFRFPVEPVGGRVDASIEIGVAPPIVRPSRLDTPLRNRFPRDCERRFNLLIFGVVGIVAWLFRPPPNPPAPSCAERNSVPSCPS